MYKARIIGPTFGKMIKDLGLILRKINNSGHLNAIAVRFNWIR